MNASVAFWLECVVAALLIASGAFSLLAAVGIVRMKSFFMRMHPPALANTLATWCVALASIVYFWAFDARMTLYMWLIPIFLSITAPVTTVLLARAALFRQRQAGTDVPPPLPNGP